MQAILFHGLADSVCPLTIQSTEQSSPSAPTSIFYRRSCKSCSQGLSCDTIINNKMYMELSSEGVLYCETTCLIKKSFVTNICLIFMPGERKWITLERGKKKKTKLLLILLSICYRIKLDPKEIFLFCPLKVLGNPPNPIFTCIQTKAHKNIYTKWKTKTILRYSSRLSTFSKKI